MTETLSIPTSIELRQELLTMVCKDLLGPAGGDNEILEEAPRERYLVGKLAPRAAEALADEDDEEIEAGHDSEEGHASPPVPPALRILPSSLGLTFTVAKSAAAMQLTARFARYQRVSREEAGLADDKKGSVWQRIPFEATSEPIPFKAGAIERWAPNPDLPEVAVEGIIRQYDDEWIVSLYLVNEQSERKQNRDAAWIFQPELIVRAPDGTAIFAKHFRQREETRQEPEQREMQMLYRHRVEFGVGHGVAIHATLAPGMDDCANELRTVVMPSFDVPRASSVTSEDEAALTDVILNMKALAEMDAAALVQALSPLAEAYDDWIKRQRARLNAPDLQPFQTPAIINLQNCDTALKRIRQGIELLARNADAAEAFRFANRAMYLQRIHSLFALDVRQGKERTLEELDVPENYQWRPFQMAFILINLPALTDPLHSERSESIDAVADVLWFPTGGGKTEAYLGLTAYTLAIRRLQKVVGGYDGGAGVAVLMRYTLRLLTLQQFQRATALICACEVIRRQDAAKWGGTPFRIGLWVGMRSTPNETEDAKAWIEASRNGGEAGAVGTPQQLTNCPWCGTAILPGRDLLVRDLGNKTGRTLTLCSNLQCDFNKRNSNAEGLPVVVVDEEIYRLLPALLIATVDKFARMPWKGETQMLFGRVDGYCPRHGYCSPDLNCTRHPKLQALSAVSKESCLPLRPPDLIIQDELHLINGPLGSLVGLYEMAVDRLSSWNLAGQIVRPKVIASSATIRQAEKQVHHLYLRHAEVFPPSGLEVEDNFFSKQRTPTQKEFGRLYLGICAPGESSKGALIRVYLAFLGAAQTLYVRYGSRADPWMTLVGYFNAVRELGGTRRVVEDEIRSRLKRIDARGLERRLIRNDAIEELTSRKSAADIPQILDRLDAVHDPEREQERQAQRRANERPNYARQPLDVLLATNMISVGVDVPRLGLMIVNGQPKYTAEYIQATSRIGRNQPGLVCTLYNWARPRDMSHYERFEHYHATFYQQVEALSVTPVSAGAVRRGLTGVLVSFIRLLEEAFNANDQAGDLMGHTPLTHQVVQEIARRAGIIENPDVGSETERRLNALLDRWFKRSQRAQEGAAELDYDARAGNALSLLKHPDLGPWDDFTVLNSLRDVELPINLILHEYEGIEEEQVA